MSEGGGDSLSIQAPVGSKINIIPTGGDSVSYQCSTAECRYGVAGQRGPWRVEARDRHGVLLDYCVVSDPRQAIKLIDSTNPLARMERPEMNLGMAVDKVGQPMWGRGPVSGDRQFYGGEEIPDDRTKPTVTIIGDDAGERQQLVQQLQSTPFSSKLVFLDYPTQTWHVGYHRVPPGGRSIVIQPPQPSSEVLHRQNDFDLANLNGALQRVTGLQASLPQRPGVDAVRQPDQAYRPEADPNLGNKAGELDFRIIVIVGVIILAVILLSAQPKETRS